MSDGNSNDYLARIGLVLIVVILLGIVVFQKSGYEHVNPVSNEYETSEYQKRAEARIENECSGIQGVDFAKCANEIEKAARDAHRSQKDLKAQRYMALWAFVMAFAGVVGLIITGVGLLFIYKTLKASEAGTRAALKAIDVTREIGQAQVRAYVGVITAKVNVSSEKISVFLTIENQGATPAHDTKIGMGWTTEESDLSDYQSCLKQTNVGSVGPGGSIERSMHSDSGESNETTLSKTQIKEIQHNMTGFWVFGGITYKTSFGECCETGFRGKIFYLGDGKWTLSICDEGNKAT